MKIFRRIQLTAMSLVARFLPNAVDAIVGQLSSAITRLENAENLLLDRMLREADLQSMSYDRQRAFVTRETKYRASAEERADGFYADAMRARRVRERIASLLA